MNDFQTLRQQALAEQRRQHEQLLAWKNAYGTLATSEELVVREAEYEAEKIKRFLNDYFYGIPEDLLRDLIKTHHPELVV